MKKRYCVLIAVMLALTMVACGDDSSDPEKDDFNDYYENDHLLTLMPVVPKPTTYDEMAGRFEITRNSKIVIQAGTRYNEVKRNVADYLAPVFRRSTGFAITVAGANAKPVRGDIVLVLGNSGRESGEAYNLSVTKTTITVTATQPEGLFRGVQTLRQLFGPDVERTSVVRDKRWRIVCAEITDNPAYPYRGIMLDVARHFFPKEVIMRQIDLAAHYKINKLHLHLTDDQGWRIEIKSRPELTAIGSLGAVVVPQCTPDCVLGGFFTQDDFIEIVQYAAARYVEVIPEIDMPGHTNAALVSIPELNPNGIAATPRYDIAVGYSSLMCRSEITYTFVDDVIRELAAISPSPVIHIGGDEADRTSVADYDYFIGRVSEIVANYGKTTMGWSPYDRAATLGDSLLQAWLDNTAATTSHADQKGMGIILSPANAYLDQIYNSRTPVGHNWRGYVPLTKSYNWKPSQLAPNSTILGVESALWAEFIRTQNDMEYLLYPRLLANAEIGWTAEENHDYADFLERLDGHFERFDALGIHYSRDYN